MFSTVGICLFLVALNSKSLETAGISDDTKEISAKYDVGMLYHGKQLLTVDQTRFADSVISAKLTKVSSIRRKRKQRRSLTITSWAIRTGKQAVKELLDGAKWIGRKNGVDFFEKRGTDEKAMKQFQDLFPDRVHRTDAVY